ncbi:hypothetical protein BKA63DRAFT_190487 [Paraphoma chrysanthemicola]|nr:hypothetical protein BKA63DRAFT_190487 [Paraphoma chrysanthemicola]
MLSTLPFQTNLTALIIMLCKLNHNLEQALARAVWMKALVHEQHQGRKSRLAAVRWQQYAQHDTQAVKMEAYRSGPRDHVIELRLDECSVRDYVDRGKQSRCCRCYTLDHQLYPNNFFMPRGNKNAPVTVASQSRMQREARRRLGRHAPTSQTVPLRRHALVTPLGHFSGNRFPARHRAFSGRPSTTLRYVKGLRQSMQPWCGMEASLISRSLELGRLPDPCRLKKWSECSVGATPNSVIVSSYTAHTEEQNMHASTARSSGMCVCCVFGHGRTRCVSRLPESQIGSTI